MNTVGYVHTVKVYFWMVGNLVRSSALLFSSRKLPAAHHTHSTAATLLREGNDRRCVWKPLVGKKMQAGDKQTLWFSVWMMRLLHPWSLILQITCAFLPCWIPVIIFRHLFITIYKVMFKSVVCVCGWGGGGSKKKSHFRHSIWHLSNLIPHLSVAELSSWLSRCTSATRDKAVMAMTSPSLALPWCFYCTKYLFAPRAKNNML